MKTIHVKTDNYNIELHLRGKYTVLGGKSATGKTYLYDLLKDSDAEDAISLIMNQLRIKKIIKQQ